jgi:NAD(P)-dependent dehydrogenase (short-subunit alcohol dehydrogenase family)
MGMVDGKIAIVTGGASGIGRAAAEALASEGAKVLVTDIDAAGLDEVVGAIKSAGGEASSMVHDVTDESAWEAVIAECRTRYGGLNVLFNNAGIGVAVPSITQMSLDDWRRQTSINLDGVFLGCKHAIPAMQASGGGSIIITSSVAGLRGSPGLAGYCATKGGVRLFAKAVALECARDGIPVRVNSVHPGIIDTPIWDKIPNRGVSAGGANRVDPAELAAATPARRPGTAQEIADGVVFLASDKSAYVNGSELVIDGGITAAVGANRPSAAD